MVLTLPLTLTLTLTLITLTLTLTLTPTERALRCASWATAAPWYSAGTVTWLGLGLGLGLGLVLGRYGVTSVLMIGSRICGPPGYRARVRAGIGG